MQFMGLSFAVGFALLAISEMIRLSKVWPWKSIHGFEIRFLNDKDQGKAILSHIYLLFSCALNVWIQM
jgi:hypothetical protein